MTGEELEAGFQGAKILTGNDYEFGMMAEKLGITEAELRRRVPITVVTKGEAGALITVEGEEYEIPPASPTAVVDPTGAGDAYRAGFVKGMARGFSWPVVGRLGALTAVYAIEHDRDPAPLLHDRRVRRALPIQLRPVRRGRLAPRTGFAGRSA